MSRERVLPHQRVLRGGVEVIAERIVANTDISYPEGFRSEFVRAIDDGYFPIVIANHSSHADGLIISKLTADLTLLSQRTLPEGTKFNGFLMPLAASLSEGQQGFALHEAYKGSKSVLGKNRLMDVPIVRKKDIKRYGMQERNTRYIALMLRGIRAGYGGIVLFPEGETTGGKTIHGKTNGMQKFGEDSIVSHVKLAQKVTGRKVMIIPVGITGGTQILNSDTRRPPLRSFVKILRPDMAKINVGRIIKEEDPMISKLSLPLSINAAIGAQVAKLLPPEMRGAYA